MNFTLRYHDQDFELQAGEFVIGRGIGCQLVLDDPMASRTHARLLVELERVVLEDLQSRNGIKVNGERISGKRRLEHGDRVAIGGQEFVLLCRSDLGADTLVQTPAMDQLTFGLMGALADKAFALGRGDEAERLLSQPLEQLLQGLESGHRMSTEVVQAATRYALKLAASTSSARWTDYLFRLYAGLKRPCEAATIDELYSLLRKVRQPSAGVLRTYLAVLRPLELSPAERFLFNRLEGLERLLIAR